MSIAHVVTGGFGNGTFAGQIRQIVVGGFFDSAVVPVQVDQLPNVVVRENTGTYQFPLAGYVTGETSFTHGSLATGITFSDVTGILTVNSSTASGTTSGIQINSVNAAGTTPFNTFSVKIAVAGGGIAYHGLTHGIRRY